MPEPKAKRTFLTNAQKLQLKEFWSQHADLQLAAVVAWVQEHFGATVGRATLYRIYHAPVAAFAGNARQKKRRSVKFPALERDVLAFYEENRRLSQSGGPALTDDALIRAAAELRERHGIPQEELKLSNGWLYRFKERHALRTAPQARGERCGEEEAETQTVKAHVPQAEKPTRKPRAPNQSRSHGSRVSRSAVVSGDRADSGAERRLALSSGTEISADDDQTHNTFAACGLDTVQALRYISAAAVRPTVAVAFVKWKLASGMAFNDTFSVDNDGIAVLRDATCQLNVELQHTALSTGSSTAIFKVWCGVELLGQCERYVRNDCGRALSVLQLRCMLPAKTVVRVEYHASGAASSESRLVLRLLDK
ncbi:hypothetical protein PHYBOEH_003858 [Phytophthora boehmeriae]|uniref:HTH CENPB-type domain-containing protein n=1 Tax=Phytophthora boehmeriae TaxID=109152 RepID=A0A8T1X4E8_9STRA|nr:hypothetical protein PHYBOEH_003858 [Phytophthora boehmeriae]